MPRRDRSPQYDQPTFVQACARVAANLKRLREARGWTQEEAAYQCNMTTAMLQLVECEATNPTLTTLARLADGFGVDVSEFLAPAKALPPRRPGRPKKNPTG